MKESKIFAPDALEQNLPYVTLNKVYREFNSMNQIACTSSGGEGLHV